MVNEQIGDLSREMETIQKNQTKLKLKRTVMEMNNSLDGLSSISEKAEDRFSTFEEKLTEFIQCEEQREKTEKKNPRTLGTYEASNSIICMQLQSQKEKRVTMRQKNILRNRKTKFS